MLAHLGPGIVCAIIHNYLVYFTKLAKVLWSLQKLRKKQKLNI